MFGHFRRYGEKAKEQIDRSLETDEAHERRIAELLEDEWEALKQAARSGELRAEVDELVGEALQEGVGTSELTQQKIFEIQKEKQMIMRKLKERLRAIDGDQELQEPTEGVRVVIYQNGRYLWKKDDGTDYPITLGSILADIGWGNRYQLDPETCPRLDRKLYALEEAREDLLPLLDKQLRRQVSGQLDGSMQSLSFRSNSKLMHKALDTGEVTDTASGFIGEQVVFSYLKTISIDYKAGFRVEPADVYQDAVQKIDFIVVVPHDEAEKIRTGKTSRKIGVQLTISPQRFAEKKEGIDKLKEQLTDEDEVDDMVTVLVPMRIKPLVEAWNTQGRPPGGPGQFLAPDARLEILTRVNHPPFKIPYLLKAWRAYVEHVG